MALMLIGISAILRGKQGLGCWHLSWAMGAVAVLVMRAALNFDEVVLRKVSLRTWLRLSEQSVMLNLSVVVTHKTSRRTCLRLSEQSVMLNLSVVVTHKASCRTWLRLSEQSIMPNLPVVVSTKRRIEHDSVCPHKVS